jgi:hypothetical protein
MRGYSVVLLWPLLVLDLWSRNGRRHKEDTVRVVRVVFDFVDGRRRRDGHGLTIRTALMNRRRRRS